VEPQSEVLQRKEVKVVQTERTTLKTGNAE